MCGCVCSVCVGVCVVCVVCGCVCYVEWCYSVYAVYLDRSEGSSETTVCTPTVCASQVKGSPTQKLAHIPGPQVGSGPVKRARRLPAPWRFHSSGAKAGVFFSSLGERVLCSL